MIRWRCSWHLYVTSLMTCWSAYTTTQFNGYKNISINNVKYEVIIKWKTFQVTISLWNWSDCVKTTSLSQNIILYTIIKKVNPFRHKYEWHKQWTDKPLSKQVNVFFTSPFDQYGRRHHETTKNSQKLKTYSAPTVGNKVCDIGGHHKAITNREDTASHHRPIVRQWPLHDMPHHPIGCHRETFKTIKWKNNYMALVSFGHPAHRQEAKEKPPQTQKKTNHRGTMSRPTMPPQPGIGSVIENQHDRAITIRESTVRHHKYNEKIYKYEYIKNI